MTDEKPKLRSLAEAEFTVGEADYQMWSAKPPAGTTREEVLNPVFWKHVARRVRAPAFINVMPLDGAWFSQLLVVFADPHRVTVLEMQHRVIEESAYAVAENQEYEAAFLSASGKYGVKRRSDKQIIRHGFASLDDARNWMTDYARTKRAA